MEAAMDVTDHHKIDKLHTLYCTTTDARLARRIQVVWLARRGLTCPQIMQAVGASRRAVQQWVAKYNRGGIDELLDKPRSGRPAFLNAKQQKQLARRIRTGVGKGDSLCVFTGPSVEELVEREFGVLYSLRGIQWLLRRLGFSYLCPRPAHEKSDPKAQAAFKKSSRKHWIRSPANTPSGG
jgi:transposase